MEKLVRDRIPEIVEKDRGEPAPFRVAPPEEYGELLVAKLREEVDEYLESRQPEELADILEVLYALVRKAGLTPQTLEGMRRKKAEARGGFGGRKVMSF